MENVVSLAMRQFMSLRDIAFYVRTHTTACVPRSIEQVGVVNLRRLHGWNEDFGPPLGTAFQHTVSLRQILQAIRERSGPIKGLCDETGITT